LFPPKKPKMFAGGRWVLLKVTVFYDGVDFMDPYLRPIAGQTNFLSDPPLHVDHSGAIS
jgi:hypothetical protein